MNYMVSKKLILLVLLVTRWIGGSFAEESLKAHAWMETINSQELGPNRDFKPISLTFSLSWRGLLRAGKTTFEFGSENPKNADEIIAKAYGGSSGLAATLFPYQHDFYGVMHKNTWKPTYFKAYEVEKEETKKTIVTYGENVAYAQETTKDIKTGKVVGTPSKKTYRFDPLYDVMSAMMYFRSLDLKKGDVYNLVIHPGNDPYLVTGTVKGYDKHKGYQCAKLDLKLQKINDDLTLKTYKKMTKATFWISRDKDRIPVELRTKVFIGDVRATMIKKKYL